MFLWAGVVRDEQVAFFGERIAENALVCSSTVAMVRRASIAQGRSMMFASGGKFFRT